MKILVIHPKDVTTDFLSASYEHLPDIRVVRDPAVSEDTVLDAIKEADVVVMMGHGLPYGLISSPPKRPARLIIDGLHAKLLKGKQCVGVWCNADRFFRSHGLSGYSTGMVVSEDSEADMFVSHPWTSADVRQSNSDLSAALRRAMDTLSGGLSSAFKDAILDGYVPGDNPVKQYNITNLS
jgi:hypothetical protein